MADAVTMTEAISGLAVARLVCQPGQCDLNGAHRMFNIVISGPGLIGTRHISLVKSHPDCRLSAIVAPLTDENLSKAREAGVPLYPSIEDAVVVNPTDGVIVSSPNEFHFVQAMACIDRGIPVLVEKPLTDDLADAQRLTEASEKAGVPVLVGHHRTYSSLLTAASSFLETEKFGKMVALTGMALFYKPADYFRLSPWRTVPGGGPILINMIHEIGLMRYFAGEIVAVSAFASNNARGFAVEDTVSMSFQFANGALGTFVLSDTAASCKSWEMTSGENPAYPYFPQESCWHFAGTHGALDFPSMKAWTYSNPEERSWWKPFESLTIPFARRDPLEAQIDHFVGVMSGKAEPRVSVRDGYQNLMVIEAIRRSIETRSIIDLDTIERQV